MVVFHMYGTIFPMCRKFFNAFSLMLYSLAGLHPLRLTKGTNFPLLDPFIPDAISQIA
jgi:hypothetical protein